MLFWTPRRNLQGERRGPSSNNSVRILTTDQFVFIRGIWVFVYANQTQKIDMVRFERTKGNLQNCLANLTTLWEKMCMMTFCLKTFNERQFLPFVQIITCWHILAYLFFSNEKEEVLKEASLVQCTPEVEKMMEEYRKNPEMFLAGAATYHGSTEDMKRTKVCIGQVSKGEVNGVVTLEQIPANQPIMQLSGTLSLKDNKRKNHSKQ